MGEVAIGLVDQEHGSGALRQLDQRIERGLVEERARGIVRLGDADQPGLAVAHPLSQLLHVEPPAVLEAQVHHVEVGPDGAGRLQVGGVVGAHDQRVVAGLEQGGGDAEEGRGGARRHEHVIGIEPLTPGGDGLSQDRVAEVVAVAEEQVVELHVDAQVNEPTIGDGALGEVVGDGVVAELLGRLHLDGHPSEAHGRSMPPPV